MTTAIPPTELSRILQTKSSHETIAALLNEAEATHSSRRKAWNAARLFPFWKTCQVCSKPYPCQDEAEVRRRVICSAHCKGKYDRQQREMHPEARKTHGNQK